MMLTMLVGCGGDGGNSGDSNEPAKGGDPANDAIEGKWVLSGGGGEYWTFEDDGTLVTGIGSSTQTGEYTLADSQITIRKNGVTSDYSFQVEGDKLVLSGAFIYTFYREGKEPAPEVPQYFTGAWANVDDEDERLIFNKNKMSVYVDGEKEASFTYERNADKVIIYLDGAKVTEGTYDGDYITIEGVRYELFSS